MISCDERDHQSVLRDLKSADDDVRRLAVERAVALGPEVSIPILVDRLGDAAWRVRKAAVERLASLPDVERVTEALIAALDDEETPGRRNSAVEALVCLGPVALPKLCRATESADTDVRKLAVDTLAGIGDPDAEVTLLERLSDSDANVRGAAAEALGIVGGGRGRAALLSLATRDDEDRLVRLSALHALASQEAPVRAGDLGAALRDPILRPAALPLLGRIDDEEASAVLLEGLASGSAAVLDGSVHALLRLISHSDRAEADGLVARIRSVLESTPSLLSTGLEQLEEADLASRMEWIQFLGLLRCGEVVAPILRAGRDEALSEVALTSLASLGLLAEDALDVAWERLDARARHDACGVLGRTRGERGRVRLLAALEDDEIGVRAAAAAAVGDCEMVEALSILVRRLADAAAEDDAESDEEVAAMSRAIVAIAAAEPDVVGRAIELFESHLQGAGESVRFAIAGLLGGIGRPTDIDLVTLLLRDPGSRVRRAAVAALVRLDPGAAAEPLRLALGDESAEVRVAAAGSLAGLGGAACLDDLQHLMRDEDTRVRAAGIRAVGVRLARLCDEPGESAGASDDRRALTEMIDAALSDDAVVALSAVEALAEVGGSTARRAVAALHRDEPELVYEAVRCLGAHADQESLEELIALVSHADWVVRAEAIHTLADRGVARAVPPILRRLELEQDEFVRDGMIRALQRLEA